MKHRILPITAIFVSLIHPASAILDVDNDTLSDPWETSYGFSATSNNIPNQAPGADPDGDGFSNLLESIAGTDPLRATPPLGLYRIIATPNLTNPLSLDLSWPQVIGKQYQVESSNDWLMGSIGLHWAHRSLRLLQQALSPRRPAQLRYRASFSARKLRM